VGAAVHTLLIDAVRPCRHVPGDRWFVDETYECRRAMVYLFGLSISMGRFFTGALRHGPCPSEMRTDRAQTTL
jgi:IS6 family transposase